VQLTSGVYNGVYIHSLGATLKHTLTQEDERLISDLAETFDNLRKFKMKLNPEKCTFGVPSGKLLRYIVSHHGIDPNSEKVSAITKMKPSESLHDVQKLTGCMTTLSKFIS
jgi:hypothetical protein